MSPFVGMRTYSSRKPPVEQKKSYIIKLSTEEHITILKKAVQLGLPIGEYIRFKALNDGTPNNDLPKKSRKQRSIPPCQE